MQSSENHLFSLAEDIVKNTSRNLFLTGKAGTGKTTFLRHIVKTCSKNIVVAAPTGIAAINAGGMTVHSLFQLSGRPFLPDYNVPAYQNVALDRYSLFRNTRMSNLKIELLRELELLIIDEVSMLRCDMLDVIDEVLRHYRNVKNQPFGGVQVLFIGDLFQLPPVVQDSEWAILQSYYQSPFFFNSKVLEQQPLLKIELKTIYRQSEQKFINLLNRVREAEMDEDDFEQLNERFMAKSGEELEDHIILTAYNRPADEINYRELGKLDSQLFAYEAEIKGDFSEKAFPTDTSLQLKAGAKVMFIKNDSSPEKRYVNGTLATIDFVSKDEITLTLADSGKKMSIEKEIWQNIRYEFNPAEDKIEEKEIGSFTQYPLRLAWAITIHKSQGLTFKKAAIDAGSAFASGQVYVALSRCTSLDGMVLLSRLHPQSIKTDPRIRAYCEQYTPENQIVKILADEKPQYMLNQLFKTFGLKKLTYEAENYLEFTQTKRVPESEQIGILASESLHKAKEYKKIGEKFTNQLKEILAEPSYEKAFLKERLEKGIAFFCKAIYDDILLKVDKIVVIIHGQKKVKQFEKRTLEFHDFIKKTLVSIRNIEFDGLTLERPELKFENYTQSGSSPKAKTVKGDTFAETFRLYNEKKTIEEIAEIRNLSVTTIEQHLALFVAKGDLDIFTFMTQEEIIAIQKVANEIGADKLTPIKSLLPESYSYMKIKMALNYKLE
ncbi:MAG: hypothetical protein EAZ53_04480 [Bacteroidetes bacterium]|nr:MAG: hypothetical protein EAZ53_04480 [Bacteroidota bacterium]